MLGFKRFFIREVPSLQKKLKSNPEGANLSSKFVNNTLKLPRNSYWNNIGPAQQTLSFCWIGIQNGLLIVKKTLVHTVYSAIFKPNYQSENIIWRMSRWSLFLQAHLKNTDICQNLTSLPQQHFRDIKVAIFNRVMQNACSIYATRIFTACYKQIHV